jgi:integrase
MLDLSLPPSSGGFNRNPNKAARAAIARALEDRNMRAKLTPALIAEMRPPTDRHESFCWDTETRGMGVRILRKSGFRSWVVQYRHRGRSIRRTIGACDRLPFTLAKERAREVLAQAALGRDWFAEQARAREAEERAERAASRETTLGAKLEEYLADPEIQAFRTHPAISRYLRKVWAPLHGLSAEEITSKELTQHLERIAVDSGIVAANRARSTLYTAYKWLLTTHRVDRDDNPVSRARHWREPKRSRAPTLEELGRIWKACSEIHPGTYGAVVKLLILTAARKSEVALLVRGEVDLERAEIVLPPARHKTGRKTGQPHWIPLSVPALRILRELPERKGLRLFPVISWARAKRALDEASGVQAWTQHDLRRAFSSLSRDELHADGEVVELALGHIPSGVRGRYDFSQRKKQRRELAEAWARLILEAAGEPVDRAPALRVVEGGR